MSKVIGLLQKLLDNHQRSFDQQKDFEFNEFKQKAKDKEGSMAAITNLSAVVEEKYLLAFTEIKNTKHKGNEDTAVNAIINEITAYCAGKFREKHKKLPIEITQKIRKERLEGKDGQERREIYFKDIFHTVIRYFSNPNPLSSSGRGCAIIPSAHKKRIALFWLAINDPKNVLREGYTRENAKELFIKEISLIARAHNWDRFRNKKVKIGNGFKNVNEEYDDMDYDRPSCSWGIKQRLESALISLKEFDQQNQIGPKIKEVINESFTACKNSLQNEYLHRNFYNFTKIEASAILGDFIANALWTPSYKSDDAQAVPGIINEWLENTKEFGVGDPNDPSKLLVLSKDKAEQAAAIFLRIFTNIRNEFSSFDILQKEAERDIPLKNRQYDRDFSTRNLCELLATDKVLRDPSLHNYAEFFKKMVLDNYEHCFEIFMENLNKCMQNVHFFGSDSVFKEKNENSVSSSKSSKVKDVQEAENIIDYSNAAVIQQIVRKTGGKQGSWFEGAEKDLDDIRKIYSNSANARAKDYYDIAQVKIQSMYAPFQEIREYCVNGLSQINIPSNGNCLFASAWATARNNPRLKQMMTQYATPMDLRRAVCLKMQENIEKAINTIMMVVDYINNLGLLDLNLFGEGDPLRQNWQAFANFVNNNIRGIDLARITDAKSQILIQFFALNDFNQLFRTMISLGNQNVLKEMLGCNAFEDQLNENGKVVNVGLINKVRGALGVHNSLYLSKEEHNAGVGRRLQAVNILHYTNLMAQQEVWGGSYELEVLADLLDININVNQQEGDRVLLVRVGNNNDQQRSISVLHCNGNHYQGLVSEFSLDSSCDNYTEYFEYLEKQLYDCMQQLMTGNAIINRTFEARIKRNFDAIVDVRQKLHNDLKRLARRRNPNIEQLISGQTLIDFLTNLGRANIAFVNLVKLPPLHDYMNVLNQIDDLKVIENVRKFDKNAEKILAKLPCGEGFIQNSKNCVNQIRTNQNMVGLFTERLDILSELLQNLPGSARISGMVNEAFTPIVVQAFKVDDIFDYLVGNNKQGGVEDNAKDDFEKNQQSKKLPIVKFLNLLQIEKEQKIRNEKVEKGFKNENEIKDPKVIPFKDNKKDESQNDSVVDEDEDEHILEERLRLLEEELKKVNNNSNPGLEDNKHHEKKDLELQEDLKGNDKQKEEYEEQEQRRRKEEAEKNDYEKAVKELEINLKRIDKQKEREKKLHKAEQRRQKELLAYQQEIDRRAKNERNREEELRKQQHRDFLKEEKTLVRRYRNQKNGDGLKTLWSSLTVQLSNTVNEVERLEISKVIEQAKDESRKINDEKRKKRRNNNK